MANKGWQGNFFEDFELGQVVDCPVPRTVTSGDVSTYIALTGDRTPVYCGASGFVHPLVTFHTVFGQTVRHISLNARANLGYAGIRWHEPARIGDTLSMQLEIVGLRENSNNETGIVYVRNTATNQHGQVVMTFWRWVMIRKRSTTPTRWLDNPVIPELPSQVEASELRVNVDAIPTQRQTGGRFRFDDYAVGERVLHFDGQTLNHSDHMSFTRLFQNSAKVHFDAVMTNGKPLIYGGVPISLGYAMALNGFENRVGIAGINSGAHTAPVHSGDTVYAFTDVLEKAVLPGSDVGALRLRMVCVKNVDPAGRDDAESWPVQIPHPKKPGALVYNENVILDLDYWELMPR